MDSIKFSTSETKALLIAYENKPKYERELFLCDSLQLEYESILINDVIQIQATEKVNETQNVLIGKLMEESGDLKKKVKKLERLNTFFKILTETVIVTSVGYSIYKEVKN